MKSPGAADATMAPRESLIEYNSSARVEGLIYYVEMKFSFFFPALRIHKKQNIAKKH